MSDNKVTLDQLDNSAVEAMSSSVGDVSMLNTENKTIVGAITEIVGKKEIANAIGEPLAETDKFTEMSSEINGLLSTFKTNMMNAGVVVESGDKFKALIDKIKNLSNSDNTLKYVEGNINSSFYPSTNGVKTFNYECDFVPSIMFVQLKYDEDILFNVFINNFLEFSIDLVPGTKAYIDAVPLKGTLTINDNKSFSITVTQACTAGVQGQILVGKYYAIGVGKDTTLNSGLDIISATELPATGRENQICVITDNPVDNFRISNLQTDILNDGNIYLKLGSGSGPSSGNITIGDTVQTIYHVDGIYQNSTKLKSYVYQDGNWIEFTKTGIDIMVNGSYTVDSETYGTLKERSGTSGSITFTDGNGLWMNYGLVSSGRYGHMHTYLTKKIDISGFTKVKVTLKDMNYGGRASTNMLAYLHFFNSAPTVSLLADPDEDGDYPMKVQSIGGSNFTSKEIVYDISDMTGSYYLDFEIYTPADDEGYYVDVRLTDFSIE